MQLRLLLAGLAASAANAATITITRTHQGVCSATSSRILWYPSSSASMGTMTSPSSSWAGPPTTSPSTPADVAMNAGQPFLISISPYAPGPGKRQLPAGGYVKVDGYLTNDKSQAATFTLVDGQLAADGWLESTSYEIDREVFAGAPSDSVGPITRLFEVHNGAVHWYSGTFDQGEAQFYYASNYVPPPPEDDGFNKRQNAGDALMVVFHGEPDASWSRISLAGSRMSN